MEIERDVQCAICLKDMVGHNKRLECGHGFHDICLKFAWGHGPVSCPSCREVPVKVLKAAQRLVHTCDGCHNEDGALNEQERKSERRISPKCGHLHYARCFYKHLNTEGLFYPGVQENGEVAQVTDDTLTQLCVTAAHGCAMCAAMNGNNSPNLHEVAAWKDADCRAFTMVSGGIEAAPRVQIESVSGGRDTRRELGWAGLRGGAGAGAGQGAAAAGAGQRAAAAGAGQRAAAAGARPRDSAAAWAGERRRSPDRRQHRDRSPRRHDNYRPRTPPHRHSLPRHDQRPWTSQHSGYRNDRGSYRYGETQRVRG